MIFIPAIDLKDNKCVRLERGKESLTTIFNNNPVEQAKYFEDKGCERIHIVDLDAAFGRPNINKETIIKIRKEIKIPIELGGGIKTVNNVSFWINNGIDFLILGSVSIKDKDLVQKIINENKNKIYIALDILNNKVMIKGWVEDSKKKIDEVLDDYRFCNVCGFVLTDISRDGMLSGLDIKLILNLLKKTNKNIIVGGGLSNYDDLHGLKKIRMKNLEGVIAGKSIYSGNIEISKALKITNTNV